MVADRAGARDRPRLFLVLYALAWAGGAVGYVPFLTILLPVKLAAMANSDKIVWLARITFCGAVAASLAGILFGWLSDRSGERRWWIVGGLAATIVLMVCVPLVDRPLSLLALIVAWQVALNMLLAPLAAWAADRVGPDELGTLGGLLAFAPAIGSLAGAIVTIPGLVSAEGRMMLVAAMVAACVLPALLFAPARNDDRAAASGAVDSAPRAAPARRGLYAMWAARLLVQIAEAVIFAYLYFYLRSVDPARDDSSIARLLGIVTAAAVPITLLVGRWSDRHRRPILPLAAAAALSSVALLVMAQARLPAQAVAGYVLFALATSTFLSLHSAQTLRVLPRADHRGRDLGIFNLTNTVPSLIMPWLTIAIVPHFGFAGLFALLAGLSLVATILLAMLARVGHRLIHGERRASFG